MSYDRNYHSRHSCFSLANDFVARHKLVISESAIMELTQLIKETHEYERELCREDVSRLFTEDDILVALK